MMARRRPPPSEPKPPLQLLQAADIVRGGIRDRIDKGKLILKISISSFAELDEAKGEYRKWSDYNNEMLKRMFNNEDPAAEYSRSAGVSIGYYERDLPRDIENLHNDIREKIHRLESISERLELIPPADRAGQIVSDIAGAAAVVATDRVFVVHGHDNEAREAVARFIEKLDLKAVILHEKADEGRTLIEKLETHSDVGFAVILLTPDDEGREISTNKPLSPRARQNVVLELGYFIGHIGRQCVCALHRGSVEIPSDYLGVLYVPFDDAGAWQLRLAKELRARGFNINMNRLISS